MGDPKLRSEHVIPSNSFLSTFPQENLLTVPSVLLTLIPDNLILVQTFGLLQTMYPVIFLYFLLVVPTMFLMKMFEMVSWDGKAAQAVRFFWP